jgi:hypothetical protein
MMINNVGSLNNLGNFFVHLIFLAKDHHLDRCNLTILMQRIHDDLPGCLNT